MSILDQQTMDRSLEQTEEALGKLAEMKLGDEYFNSYIDVDCAAKTELGKLTELGRFIDFDKLDALYDSCSDLKLTYIDSLGSSYDEQLTRIVRLYLRMPMLEFANNFAYILKAIVNPGYTAQLYNCEFEDCDRKQPLYRTRYLIGSIKDPFDYIQLIINFRKKKGI